MREVFPVFSQCNFLIPKYQTNQMSSAAIAHVQFLSDYSHPISGITVLEVTFNQSRVRSDVRLKVSLTGVVMWEVFLLKLDLEPYVFLFLS